MKGRDNYQIAGSMVALFMPLAACTLALWVANAEYAVAAMVFYVGGVVSLSVCNLALYFWALGEGERDDEVSP